ncbi:MAG: hypothetical protein K2O45_15380 [Oscillospiraceae bacterium]|nr:hypothetical protein [Oscillospiraceae bacterium]
MANIKGTVAGREGVLASVLIEIKNEHFETMYQTLSDESGKFELSAPDGSYPFLTAVRDYGGQYLEYWAQNVPAQQEVELHIRIDTLEVYGLHAFIVKGAANALSIYFRPMSLEKFKAGEADIAPVLKENDITVFVNGQESKVYVANLVREYIGKEDEYLSAYLIQSSIPEGVKEWERIDITICDSENHFGCATLFC